jgi:hypothetical protein
MQEATLGAMHAKLVATSTISGLAWVTGGKKFGETPALHQRAEAASPGCAIAVRSERYVGMALVER